MSFSTEEQDRKVIPIWDLSKLASSLAENSAIKTPKHRTTPLSETDKLRDEFTRSPQAGTAVELLNLAKLENNHEAVFAASKRIVEDGTLPSPIIDLARKALFQPSDVQQLGQPRERIAALKKNLVAIPQNTLCWVDLAREYISVGQIEPAKRAMKIALGLAPAHRWVSRVASRLYVHLGDYEKSQYLLSRHPALKSDPWIASAELSVAQLIGKTSKNLSFARRMLDAGLHPRHTTELASSLGTLELESGAIKRAKIFIQESLLYPNRNTLAQAMWAEQNHDIKSNSHSQIQSSEIAYEAKTRESYILGQAESALKHALDWLEAEPFSIKSSTIASYIASLDDQYEKMIDITRRGLTANPSSSILKLNLAYAELGLITPLQPSEGDKAKISGWVELFDEELKEGGSHHAQALANYGMLCYRMGYLEYGRRYYEAAEKFCESDNRRRVVSCTIYHAREAILAKAEWAPTILERARFVTAKMKDIGKLEGPDSLHKINQLFETPENYNSILKIPKHAAIESTSGNLNRLKFADSITDGLSFHLPGDFRTR